MDTKDGAALIAVAIIGAAGMIAAGWLGFQSGERSVNKDYVQMAVANLASTTSSPEMRAWSVQILNKLAPIPLNESLQKQLIVAAPFQFHVKIPLPAFAQKECDDVVGDEMKRPWDGSVKSLLLSNNHFAREYVKCRQNFQSLRAYVINLNKTDTDKYDSSNNTSIETFRSRSDKN